jgi:hypothetical protein
MTSHLLMNLAYLLARYLHIVCATVLVGGTLFYEMIVPQAITELRDEHQLAIFARARWFFRSLVWVSGGVLILSGIISSVGHWHGYNQAEANALRSAADLEDSRPATQSEARAEEGSSVVRPGWWWAAHASTGVIGVLIAVSLTVGRRPPENPVRWMRLNLGILLIVMFLGTATRQVRLIADQKEKAAAPTTAHLPPTNPEAG